MASEGTNQDWRRAQRKREIAGSGSTAGRAAMATERMGGSGEKGRRSRLESRSGPQRHRRASSTSLAAAAERGMGRRRLPSRTWASRPGSAGRRPRSEPMTPPDSSKYRISSVHWAASDEGLWDCESEEEVQRRRGLRIRVSERRRRRGGRRLAVRRRKRSIRENCRRLDCESRRSIKPRVAVGHLGLRFRTYHNLYYHPMKLFK